MAYRRKSATNQNGNKQSAHCFEEQNPGNNKGNGCRVTLTQIHMDQRICMAYRRKSPTNQNETKQSLRFSQVSSSGSREITNQVPNPGNNKQFFSLFCSIL